MRVMALPVVAVGLTVWAATPRPTDTETAGDVERARAVAADYVKHIPDFVCTQTIHRYMRFTLPKKWLPLDTLSVKLRYSGQNEERQLIQHDGQPSGSTEEEAGGLRNVGEFGGMLETLFAPESQAEFHWESFKMFAGRQVAVFSYRVSRARSTYSLTFDPGGYAHVMIVGYHGMVDVDRETGGVLRLVYEADTIAPEFPMQFASTTVEYGYVEVAGKRYLLPVRSEIETDADGLRSRNISEFTRYRKFSTDSFIQFGDTVGNQ